MRKGKSISTNFLIQGSILAVAGIICRIIGFVYRIFMIDALDNDGLAYYSRAYNVYNIALIISSYGMPLAVSKLIATKVALKEYKNERRILYGAMSFALITGLVTALVVFFCDDFFAVTLFNMPECALPLKVLAPTIFMCAIMGTLRGYFQGNGNMVPTSISQIIEQIINAVVSVVATITFMKIYNDKSYGAAGGTLGTTIGALSGLLFLIIIFIITNRERKEKINSDITSNKDAYSDIYKLILITIMPIIISQTVYNLNGIIDSSVFCHLNNSKYNDKLIGAYDVYTLMVSIPVAIATALSNSLVPVIVKERVKGNADNVKVRIHMAIKYNMIIAIPAVVGLLVMSNNIVKLLFPRSSYIDVSTNLIMIGSLAVVFYALSTISTAILQAIELMKVPIINSSISLVVHLIFVVILIKNGFGIYSLAIGNVIFALGVAILNWIVISRKLQYKQEIKYTFIIPTICAIIMGICVLLVNKTLSTFINSNIVVTIVCVISAVCIYSFLLIKLNVLKITDIMKVIKKNK